MIAALEDLMCEPWGFPVGIIADLTDSQVNRYRLAQAERVRRASDAAGSPAAPARAPTREHVRAVNAELEDAPPHRGTFIGAAVSVVGMSRAEAERQYDAALDAWRRSRGS